MLLLATAFSTALAQGLQAPWKPGLTDASRNGGDLGEGGLRASFESEYQWFDRRRVPDMSGLQTWRSLVWSGERVQAQMLIDGMAAGDELYLVASDLVDAANGANAIPAGAVSFREPRFVKGDAEARSCGGYEERDAPVWLADALYPLAPRSGEPFFRSGRYPRAVWISVDIPRDAPPGEYRGAISAHTGSGAATTVDISIKVTGWHIPADADRRFHLDLWQFPVTVLDRYHDANPHDRIAPWSERHYRLLEPFYRYLAGLGQRALTTYIKDGAFAAPSMIEWIALDGGERWEYDYSAFDAHVQRLAAWGLDGQINAFSPVGWNPDTIVFRDGPGGESKAMKVPLGSREFNALWHNFLTDFKRHLRPRGWFDRTVLYMDEVPEDQMVSVIRLIRYNDPDWKIGLAYGRPPGQAVIDSLYDVSGLFAAEQQVGLVENLGQLATFYTSCTQKRPNSYVATGANPTDMTAMGWYAAARGYHGYLRWAYDNWKSADPLDLRDGAHTAGDFSLVYRSGNGADMTVVPSVRSELLRDGIEDYEKIRILSDAARACGEKRTVAGEPARSREFAFAGLADAVESFAADALQTGHARELVIRARRVLDRISESVVPGSCATGS